MTITICVVDDDDIVREQIAQFLRDGGHDVREAVSARAAAVLIAAGGVDVAVVDILMPERDGLELIPELRRQHPGLRIIAISGGGRLGPRAYLDLACRLGADISLPKPVTRSDLLLAVQPVRLNAAAEPDGG